MKYKLSIKIACYLMLGMLAIGLYSYSQKNPAVLLRTEISPIDEETFMQLGSYEKNKSKDQNNYQEVSFSLKVNYPNEIENLEVRIPQYFSELFGNDIYLGAKYKESNNKEKYQFIHEAEILLYTGNVTNEEIRNILDEGIVNLSWVYEGENIQQKYNIGDSVIFIK
ncbi:hypothetical protein CD29_07820 [Ureibacillus manganicus DSM 26584]|uniref:Uncharacterized protein n=2 Tax=Ureibacillus TaxID=160795 RepID=A0A0A3I6U6_9BACL|nr:hypothetical protein CD29_07820 [Ureibacillus manganicus DSM 26584]